MKSKVYISLSAVLLTCFFAVVYAQERKADDGTANYLSIRRYYLRWDQEDAASRGYFRNLLYDYLVEMIGREIKTDYDYIPEYPDIEISDHRARIRSGEWLVISGEISAENIKEIDVFRKKYGRNSQPGKGLFSISGRIKKFRLSDYSGGRSVYLYLDDMKIKNAEVIHE